MSIIDVKSLSFSYGRREVLRNLNFEIKEGSFLAIAGPNGAGKSTLINLLCGQLKSKSGSIHIDGTGLRSYSSKSLAKKIAVVRQEFVPVFDFNVTEIVSMARAPYMGRFGFESEEDKKIIAEALEVTETIQFASRPLTQLSGGERQRVFIARSLAANSPVLLLDEPTNFLDLKHQVGIYDLLKIAQLEKDKTIVAVTHDINLAAQYCDESLLLGADSLYQYGRPEDVFAPEQIERVFGVTTFAGKVGREKFFIPLGRFAKDSGQVKSTPSREDGPSIL